MPRLFTGLDLPSDVAFQLELLKGGIPGARWIDTDAFHITLRYAGDISDTDAFELDQALAAVEFEPFELQLNGVGFFGGSKPRSLHAGIKENVHLARLQATHERVCQMIGLPAEGRRYTPHVTLARFKSASSADVAEFVSQHNLFASRPFLVRQFVLFSARPGRGGGPYVHEQTYDLACVT